MAIHSYPAKTWLHYAKSALSPFPYGTYFIITALVICYFRGLSASFSLAHFQQSPTSLITYAFTHGNFNHLFWNCFFLLIFGAPTEYFIGSRRFIFIWFNCAIVAGLGFSLVMPENAIIGASGAVSGIVAIWPFTRRDWLQVCVAGIAALVYFYLEFQASLGYYTGFSDGVAHISHVAGAVGGLICFNFITRSAFKQ